MLDGRVLGASQVEYKPFGKFPLKREAYALSVIIPFSTLIQEIQQDLYQLFFLSSLSKDPTCGDVVKLCARTALTRAGQRYYSHLGLQGL